MSRQKIFFVLASLLLITAVFGYFYFFQRTNEKKESPLYEELLSSDESFSKGSALLAQGKCQEALPYFETSLNNTKGKETEANARYLVALTYSCIPANETTEYLQKSLFLYKEIIKDPGVPNIIKAQAVQDMDRLLFSRLSTFIRETISADEPYRSFSKDNSLTTFRRALLEYGQGFYPTADIEMRLAELYVKGIVELQKELSGNEADIVNKTKLEREKFFISKAIEKGSADLKERIEGRPYLNSSIPDALLHKAIAAQYYIQVTQEAPFGDPERLFQEALDSVEKLNPVKTPLTKYFYAVFLAEKNNSDDFENIRELLRPFYETPDAIKKNMAILFGNEKDNILGEKEHLILLSTIDPRFKNLLTEVGWTESHFTPAP